MKLTYRGIQYEPNLTGQPTVPTTEAGTYRGVKLQFRKPCPPHVASGFAMLTYRGARYRSFRHSQTAPVAAD